MADAADASGERSIDKLRAQFAALSASWKDECGCSSNMVKIFMQPSYQRIIGLGPDILPVIFEEMQREPDWWFWSATRDYR